MNMPIRFFFVQVIQLKKEISSIIFLIVEMTNDELGALSGKLGQSKDVKVSATTIKA